MIIRAQKGLTFDDVLLVPKRSPIASRRDVDTSAAVTNTIRLATPILSANMDTVTECGDGGGDGAGRRHGRAAPLHDRRAAGAPGQQGQARPGAHGRQPLHRGGGCIHRRGRPAHGAARRGRSHRRQRRQQAGGPHHPSRHSAGARRRADRCPGHDAAPTRSSRSGRRSRRPRRARCSTSTAWRSCRSSIATARWLA